MKNTIDTSVRYLLIVNPESGDRKARKKIGAVRRYFQRRRLSLQVALTKYPGHATEIASSCGENADVIIGAGGDGTINEVIQGMIGSGKTLAILPWGTGNVFAYEMGLPRGIRRLCRLIIKGRPLTLDLGNAGGRYFLLMLGAGFDAYTLKHMSNDPLKRIIGRLAYVFGALKAFLRYRHPLITAVFPDGTEISGTFVLVSNTSRYGTFFTLTPRALPLDGMLDVFIYQGKGNLRLLLFGIQTLFTAFDKNALLSDKTFFQRHVIRRTPSVTLTADDTVSTQLDGDHSGTLPVTVHAVPRAVNIILPRKTIRRMRRLMKRYVGSVNHER